MTGADFPNHVELTAREREVLALVVQGKTNRDIGATLFISESTAGVHVSNILAKLGVASRTEAAALVTRSGLLETASAPSAEVDGANSVDAAPELVSMPATPMPTGWSARLRERMRRHPRSTAIVGGGVVVLAAITTGLAFAVLTADQQTGSTDASATPLAVVDGDVALSPTATSTALGSPTPTPSPSATPTGSITPSPTPTGAPTLAPVAAPTATPTSPGPQRGPHSRVAPAIRRPSSQMGRCWSSAAPSWARPVAPRQSSATTRRPISGLSRPQ